MDKILLVIVFLIFSVSVVFLGTTFIRESIRADLIRDMAKNGYYQQIIDDKILWTKFGK